MTQNGDNSYNENSNAEIDNKSDNNNDNDNNSNNDGNNNNNTIRSCMIEPFQFQCPQWVIQVLVYKHPLDA